MWLAGALRTLGSHAAPTRLDADRRWHGVRFLRANGPSDGTSSLACLCFAAGGGGSVADSLPM